MPCLSVCTLDGGDLSGGKRFIRYSGGQVVDLVAVPLARGCATWYDPGGRLVVANLVPERKGSGYFLSVLGTTS